MRTYFFILSFSRSGSTVLGQKLNNHSEVSILNESWIFNYLGILRWKKLTPRKQRFLVHLINKNKSQYNSSKVNVGLTASKPLSVKRFYNRIFEYNTTFIGEKTPTNIFYVDYIRKRIKDAKFVFLKRHPLAIASSYYRRWYSSNYNDDFLINVVSTIIAYHRKFEQIIDKSNIIQVKYEDLVSDSKRVLENISSHLGFGFEEKMLDVSEEELFKNKAVKHHHQDSSKKLNTNHLNKYKDTFTQEQIAELSYLLSNQIKAMDYQFDEEPISNKRLEDLNKKIQHKISAPQVNKRKKIQKIKLQLSYLKYNLLNI